MGCFIAGNLQESCKPERLKSTPLWRLASLVLASAALASGLGAWVGSSLLGTSPTAPLLFAAWAAILAIGCWQGPKVWLEGVRYDVTDCEVVVTRGFFRRAIERRQITLARVCWYADSPEHGDLELVRAAPRGVLRRQTTLRLVGVRAPDRLWAMIRGAETPASSGPCRRPLSQRLDAGERVVWSGPRHARWTDWFPPSRRERLLATIALFLGVTALTLGLRAVALAERLSDAGLAPGWVAVVAVISALGAVAVGAVGGTLAYVSLIVPARLARDTRYLVTNRRILIQRGHEELHIDKKRVVDALSAAERKGHTDLVLVLDGLLVQSHRAVADRLSRTFVPVLEAVDDVEGLRRALSLHPRRAAA